MQCIIRNTDYKNIDLWMYSTVYNVHLLWNYNTYYNIFCLYLIQQLNEQEVNISIFCFRLLLFFSSNKNNPKDFQIICSSLQAKLTYSVMLWIQASRVTQTVKRPSSLTDSLTDHSHTYSRSTTIPCQDVLPLFSSFHLLSDSLFTSYWRPSVASPCVVLKGSVDSAGPAGIVARWSVLLVSE